jgi:hypothetical protein
MIRTSSKRPRGHISAGVFHHPQPRYSEFADGDFNADQLKQLRRDRELVVEEIDGEPTGQPPARALPPAGGAGEDAAYLERKAALADLERSLAARKDALDAADTAMTARQKAIDELLANETFRAIALRYGVRRVIESAAAADFTKNHAPTTEAISREALGLPCSAQERDALVAEMSPPK